MNHGIYILMGLVCKCFMPAPPSVSVWVTKQYSIQDLLWGRQLIKLQIIVFVALTALLHSIQFVVFCIWRIRWGSNLQQDTKDELFMVSRLRPTIHNLTCRLILYMHRHWPFFPPTEVEVHIGHRFGNLFYTSARVTCIAMTESNGTSTNTDNPCSSY